MRNNKGLTLIELLGVIVILGIIALIAVPLITNVVENTRKDAFIANVNTFIDFATTDAQTKNLENGSTIFIYVIDKDDTYKYISYKDEDYKDEDTYDPSKLNESDLHFNKSLGFTQGAIKITFDDGSVTVDIFEQFKSSKYQTKNEATLPLERKEIDPVGTTDPEPSE